MIKYDVIVIGAGPSGMMSAGILSKRGKNVLIIEKNEKVGRKLAITGKGRCNVTNKCTTDEFIKNVTRNNKFLYSSINNFNSDDTIEFFESMGVKLKIERGNRVFPESDNAYDIVDALKKHIKRCKLIRGRVSKLIINEGNVNGVQLDNNRTYMASKVIIACGGKSYPGTGSNGDGYMLATQANHSITKLKGSLVPLVSSDEWIKELQGLSLKNVSIEVKDVNNKTIYKDFGELIFTHFGLSGPIILSASTHMSFDDNNNGYIVKIDLKPSLTIEQLNNRILRDFEKFYNKDFINALSELLPKKIIPVIVKLSSIDAHKKCNQITREERNNFIGLIKDFKVNICDLRPISEAIITSGGVNVSEINPRTMESKITKGLYFVGEVIDVDAYTGGFNLQIAFSTAHQCGMSID